MPFCNQKGKGKGGGNLTKRTRFQIASRTRNFVNQDSDCEHKNNKQERRRSGHARTSLEKKRDQKSASQDIPYPGGAKKGKLMDLNGRKINGLKKS